MENNQIHAVQEIQGQFGVRSNFDTALRGILFGKGSTMIFMFRGSFVYYTDMEAEGSQLENVCRSPSLFVSDYPGIINLMNSS
jgi:hypothetical protein